MSRSAAPVIQYLRQLEERGQTHVNVNEEARRILREFYLRARNAPASPVLPSAPATQAVERPKPSPSTETPSEELVASGNSPAEKIASLRQQIAHWPPLLQLKNLRKTMVFSVGDPEADIMLVGEAPGYDEERLVEPFVGKAGQKLDGILKAMGVERSAVYISNIVKFRPAMPNQTTNNRKPTREEIEACLPFIREEVKVVAPKVIIALGGTAAHALLDCDDPVGKMRGRFHRYLGIPLRVTYHPSYILHNEATTEKRKLWEDMLSVMDLLGMPVSEKQRRYFLPKSS